MRRGTFTYVLIAWVLATGPSLAAMLDERDWLLVSSENFRVHSVLGKQRTTELLRHLEVMHAAFGGSQEIPTYESSIPTIILAVDNHDDYVAIGAPERTIGFFVADLRESAILVEDSSEAHGVEVVLHEYVHYLSQRSGHVRYPRWFEEGRAEYLSASRLSSTTLEYGLPARRRLSSLTFESWLPLERILETTDISSLNEIEGDLFYGQSWLLVHYLYSQPDAEQKLEESAKRYSELVSRGTPRTLAFERAFHQEVELLEATLLKYFLDRSFVSKETPAAVLRRDFTPSVRPLKPAEARLALAQMALRLGNLNAAETWFMAVLADDELRAHAEAGLGRVLGMRGNIDAAKSRFDTAIYLMAWDFRIWMDFAQFWAQRVSVTHDTKTRTRYASRLVEALESALTISDATPEVNSLMGFAYLAMGKDILDAVDFLEAAAREAPNDQASRLLLANAYLYLGNSKRAIAMAEAVLRYEHERNEITVAAQDVIAKAEQSAAN